MLLHLRPVMCVFSGVAGPAIILSSCKRRMPRPGLLWMSLWTVWLSERGLIMVQGKADCLIGNRVAPQKSPDTLGSSLASLELYLKAPMEQSFNTIIESLGFFSLLGFTFENNYFSHNYLNVLNLLNMVWINC